MAKKTATPSAPAGSIQFELLVAVALFSAAAFLIFAPMQSYLRLPEMLLPVNSVLAATGCFLLGRRWIPTLDASLLAGLLYGFGPYLISVNTAAHPMAGLGLALLPWLFCPAALWHKYRSTTFAGTLTRTLLLAVPFLVLFLWFWLPARPFIGPYFLMPTGSSVSLTGLSALTGRHDPNGIITGFVASGLILSLLGTLIFLRTAKVSVFLPALAGMILTVWDPILDINPAVWFAFPALFLSIAAGVGSSTAALFGAGDRKWIIACVILAAVLLLMMIIRMFDVILIFTRPAVFYGLTAVLLTLLLFSGELPFRTVLLRRLLLAALVALNVYFAARNILL